MSSNATSSSSPVRAKRPRLSSPAAASTANDSHSDQDGTPPSPHRNPTAEDNDDADAEDDTPTQFPPSAGPAPRKLKPYRLRPDTAQPTTPASSAVNAQAALLRDVLVADLQAEETMLANLSDSVAAEFSRTLIEQSELRATYAHWAAIPDTDPFWSQPEMLVHFAPHIQGGDEESVFAAPPSVQPAGRPGLHPPQDLFSSVRPGNAADNGDETDEDLASLFAYLPVPSSVSPTQDAACLDPSELQADEEPPLDLDTLEELLGIAGGGGAQGGEAAGYRPPPRPTQMIDLLRAGARQPAEEWEGREMELGDAEDREQQQDDDV